MDLIIISYNTKLITERCISTAFEHHHDLDIILVDNNSTDGTCEYLSERYPEIQIIRNSENLGYAKAVNIGAAASKSEIIAVSNSDVEFIDDSLKILEDYLHNHSDIAVCGPQQFYPDGKWQYSYGELPGIKLGLFELLLISGIKRNLAEKSYLKGNRGIKFPGYLDGALLVIKKSVFDAVSGFDEDYFFYTEEADFCKKVSKIGYKVAHIPDARIIHLRGGSSGHFDMNYKKAEMFINSKILFCNKHLRNFEKKTYRYLEIAANFNKFLVWSIINFLKHSKKSASKKNWFDIMYKTWIKSNYE